MYLWYFFIIIPKIFALFPLFGPKPIQQNIYKALKLH